MNHDKIDTTDIPEITDFTGAVKNPYYEKLMSKGFSITVHYTPKDAADISKGICSHDIDLFEYDDEELAALEQYRESLANAI